MSAVAHGLDGLSGLHTEAPAGVLSSPGAVAIINACPPPEPVQPSVAILMCTYNGQAFLAEQLNSIAAQSHHNWTLSVSDDGSQDGTHDVLEACRQRWGAQRLTLHRGPGRGFAANFLSLSCMADLSADFYAYADQDDLWHADKLRSALEWLQRVPADLPALYCSRTELIDECGRHLGFSPRFDKKTQFANSLVQSVGGGNTMVFNRAALELLREAGAQVNIVSHDWWLYMLVAGCGGRVVCDDKPTVRYRQHAENILGSNASWSGRLFRMKMLLTGNFRSWNDTNIAALQGLKHRLTEENRKRFDYFVASRNQWFLPRVINAWRSGIYRQTAGGNLGLILATLTKRL